MKVILINPKSTFDTRNEGGRFMPMGLILLAGAIRSLVEVRIIDLNIYELKDEELLDQIGDAELVGMTCFMDTFCEVNRLCREIKKKHPEKKIVLGGPFATIEPELYLKHTAADVVVVGEGEETFPELLKTIGNGNKMSLVRGIAFRDKKKIIRTKERPEVDLNKITPAYDLFKKELRKYIKSTGVGPVRKALAFTTSRGCPYNCGFCNPNYLGQYREMKANTIIKHLRKLSEAVPELSGLYFMDATFAYSEKRAREVCTAIKPLRFNYEVMTRASTLTSKILNLMKDSGCRQISLGIESFSDAVLKEVNKNSSTRKSTWAIGMIEKAGLKPICYVLLGLPGDTRGAMKNTVNYLKEKAIYIRPNILTPIPGTSMYKLAREQGRIKSLYKYVSWLSNNYQKGNRTIGINLSSVPEEYIKSLYNEVCQNNKKVR